MVLLIDKSFKDVQFNLFYKQVLNNHSVTNFPYMHKPAFSIWHVFLCREDLHDFTVSVNPETGAYFYLSNCGTICNNGIYTIAVLINAAKK